VGIEAGWSGRAVLSGGQESQTKGQWTVRLPPQWATTEAARRGGQKDYSNDNLLKETSNGQKQMAKEALRLREIQWCTN
jgi:hypothetical protein